MSQPELREISIDDIRRLVEPDYMVRAIEVFDGNLVSATSRYANKLFANVAGSGANPYRVSITFESQIKARCTCPAARRTPFCKHAAAVLISWARAPRSFVESDTEIKVAEPQTKAKKASVKKSSADSNELIGRGLNDLERLLSELSASGLSTMTIERAQQVNELGENLRTLQLRRLSAAVIRLAGLLTTSTDSKQDLSFDEYNSTLVEISLTARAVRQIQQGKLTDPKYQEELVGKTWSKGSLSRIGARRLMQVSYNQELTPDNYSIHERHLIDLESGELYAEKSIAPVFIAKRQGAPFGRHFKEIGCSDVLLYPGFTPNRVRIEEGTEEPAAQKSYEKLLGFAADDFEKAAAQLLQLRKDVFAPRKSVVLIKTQALYYDMQCLYVSDEAGRCIQLEAEQTPDLMLELQTKSVVGLLGYMDAKNGTYTLKPLTFLCRQGNHFSAISCARADSPASNE